MLNKQKLDGRHFVALMLIIVGFIHLLPMAGISGVESLLKLYGMQISDPNLEILMRHRAVLFGVLGSFLIYSAFRPALQGLALTAGFVSVTTFLLLAQRVGDYNALIGRVVTADVIALGCLVLAFLVYLRHRK